MTKRIHDLDVNRLLQALKNPERAPEEEQWLREQLDSRELQEGLWTLGHAVFPDRFCRVCTATLPYYVHRQATSGDAEAAYPHVKAHLDQCSGCAQAYQELYQMAAAAYADQIPVASSYPAFDFSFLMQPTRTPTLDWSQLWKDATAAGARVHRLATEITLSLAAPFTQLAASLRPALVTVAVQPTRDARVEGDETIEVLDLKYPPANLLIRIGRGPIMAQKTAVILDILQMEPPEPIPAARVTLCDEQGRLMERVGTDMAGSARFEDVEMGRYLVQVQRAEDTWELPVALGAS
ncbi:MAG: carboxypeptidase-like regulatory domain-containing protein [Chloroflexi bacterium]|nr:carboxypeptidase-like regulatory domain-containing protein [Chloroflexota bacterium]MBU1750495.1 carboxypeptidase-like regulatory domain-containing protein [Chloroflexota bacterium]